MVNRTQKQLSTKEHLGGIHKGYTHPGEGGLATKRGQGEGGGVAVSGRPFSVVSVREKRAFEGNFYHHLSELKIEK